MEDLNGGGKGYQSGSFLSRAYSTGHPPKDLGGTSRDCEQGKGGSTSRNIPTQSQASHTLTL